MVKKSKKVKSPRRRADSSASMSSSKRRAGSSEEVSKVLDVDVLDELVEEWHDAAGKGMNKIQSRIHDLLLVSCVHVSLL